MRRTSTMTLKLSAILLVLTVTLDGHVTAQCPRPCRCLKFQGLWSVYCNSTGITSVPQGFATKTQLLDLSDNSIGGIPNDAFTGLVNLQELDLSGIGLLDSSISDKALYLPNLRTIYMDQNSFTKVPKNLPRNITYLGLYGNKINYLAKDSFVNYTNLSGFDMQQTGLSAIEIGTFDVLTQISTIDISFNNLTDESFPDKLFSKNVKLEYVRLRFNQLRHMVKDMPASILHIDYVGNQITTLPSYGLQTMPHLQTAEFWEGQVGARSNIVSVGSYKIMPMRKLSFPSFVTSLAERYLIVEQTTNQDQLGFTGL